MLKSSQQAAKGLDVLKRFIVFVCLLFVITGCGTVRLSKSEMKTEPDLETKIGQMLLIGFQGTDLGGENRVIKEQIESGEIGGILILPYNIVDPSQLKVLVDEIKSTDTRYPLLVAIDQEGGKIGRLKEKNGFEDFPSNKYAAKSLTPAKAYESYFKMAKLIKKIGFNINFAPVVDLDINPDSPAIGKYERSFSKDPDTVIKYAEQFIVAHRKAGVLTSLKHFPGHGSAKEDSHLGLTDITTTWQKQELLPYAKLISNELADTVMTAHIMNTNVDDKYPVSLSEIHINENLRQEMKYDGVVITDDMQMGAISKLFEFEEIVIRAINSGSDILLFANYFNPDHEVARKALKIIIKAVKTGKIKKETIERSFRRISKLKEGLK